MDGHMHDPSDLSSMDDELHHQYAPQDATMMAGDDADDIDQQHSSCPWYYQPQYSRFWQHYVTMKSWMQTYVIMHRNRSGRYPSVGYPHMMNRFGTYPQYSANYHHPQPPFSTRTSSLSPNWNVNSQRTPNQYDSSASHYHNNAPQSRTHCDNEYREYEYSNEGSDDESMEIEISQEMIDFFKTSQKFREERDRGKAESEKKAKASKKKRRNPVRAEEKNDCRAPVERPDEGRRKGMKVLYGKHSARIHSMETAMQMHFDRNCDRFQPAYWPIVALKM